MALVLKDRVKETSTSTGTGNFVLAGAATGFQSFASALADGDTTYYAIEDGTEWETGLGTWTEATSTLARTTVYESSNSGNAVDWGAGTKNVFITQPASKKDTIQIYANISDLPLVGNIDAGTQAWVSENNSIYIWNGAGWFRVAAINLTPTITTQPDANYQFDTYGTALQVTVEATDPEGFPITWSANPTGMTGLATVSNVDNVFTFTPSTDAADQGQSFTVNFSASDGVNTAVSDTATFTIGIDNLAQPSVGTLTITAPTGQAVFISGLSALWKDVTLSVGTSSTNGLDNSTFIDRSTNAHTVTPTGSPVQSAFHPYLENWSSVHKTSPNSHWYTNFTSQTGASGDFTVELWFHRGSSEALYRRPFSIGSGPGDALETWGSGVFELKGTFSNLSGSGYKSSDTDLDKWHHIALCRESGNLMLFIDGELAAQSSPNTNTTDFNLGHIIFGAVDDGGGYALVDSMLADIRVVNGTAVYTSAFTPPTEKLAEIPNTIYMWNGNRIMDTSSNNNDVVIGANGCVVEAHNPYGQESEYAAGENKGSIRFADGVSEKIEWAAFGSSSTGTIEFWMYLTTWSASSGNQGVWAQGSFNPGIFLRANGDTLDWYEGGNKTITYQPRSGEWIHVAYSIDNGSLSEYVNGTRTATASVGGFSNSINRLGTDGQSYFDGYISDFRMTYGVARYSGTTMTVPTSPVGTDADTKIYLPMDNAGVFDKTGNHTLTLLGDASTSTTQTKFADTAIYFDGSGDLVSVNNVPPIGNGDYTIEFWMNGPNVETGTWQSLVSRDYASTDGFRLYKKTGVSELAFYSGGSSVRATTVNAGLTNNTWHHIAAVRNSGTLDIYVDGVSKVSVSNSDNISEAVQPINIGGNIGEASDYPYTGYLENLQILNGIAKYTANFTVPDQEQGRNNQAES